MAYDTFQFGYNPFEKYQRPVFAVVGGDYGDSNIWGMGATHPMEDAWRFSPELSQNNPDLYNNWLNPSNMQILGETPEGLVQFRVKTGDKEGTLYTLRPDGQGGYSAAPESQSRWDSTNKLSKWGPFLPMLAMGGASLVSGLAGTGFGGSGIGTAGTSAATGGTSGSSIFGSGGAFADKGLTATGLPGVTQMGVPSSLGGDALLAGSSLEGALGGVGATAPLTNAGIPVTAGSGLGLSQIGVSGGIPAAAGAAFGIPSGGFPGANIPPTGMPNINTNPYNIGPGPSAPSSGLGNLAQSAAGMIPGAKTQTPNLGNNATGLLDWLTRAYDSYNKWKENSQAEDKYFEWANKIFGRSADFENMLMGTYQNPSGWLEGPEGQALNRITQNQALRTDSRAGNLSNDINRSVVLQDRMMQGLGNYRRGLSQDAALGRNASSVALSGISQGLGASKAASQWYTPLTYGAGNSGQQSVGGTITDIWNTGKELWKWLDNLVGG